MLGSPEYMEGFERSEKVLPVRIVSEANLNKTNVKAKLNLIVVIRVSTERRDQKPYVGIFYLLKMETIRVLS